jgi:tetratricopeptide (TPR) repeat protein
VQEVVAGEREHYNSGAMGGKRRQQAARPEAPPPPATPGAPARRRAAWAGVALAALALAGALWWRPGAPEPQRDPGASVLLISIDTLRADALGAYGRKDAATPWIDRLAAGGVRFEQARAHNVVTLPSHANLLSGQHPFMHGVRDNSGFRFPETTETLATLLRARGWRTGAFVSAFPLDSRFGLTRGFEVYDDRLGGAETHSSFLTPERRGAATTAAAVQWLARHRGERTFCFVHLYEPHFPYDPPEPFASRFGAQERYLGEVAAADAALEPLLRPLLEARDGRTIVVLTSDHGESLGEHGEASHGVFAYESTLRVPLVIYAPRILQSRVVTAPVRHVDVLPTLLDALGISDGPALPGSSLLAAAATGRPSPQVGTYFESLSTSLNQGWAPLSGLVDGGLKYIDLPIPELYDLASDPGETRNLAGARVADLERLRALLAKERGPERGVTRVPEDPAALERLRALGYVAGNSVATKTRYTEADDPKRLIGLEVREGEVLRLLQVGDLEGARALCRENIRLRPDMTLAHLHLAYLERALGRLEAAVAAARTAVSLRPGDPETVSLLATYLTEAGRAKEALELLGPPRPGDPPTLEVLTARGMALAALGRGPEAMAAFEEARAVDASNAMVLVNIGTVHLMSRDLPRARQALEGALALDAGLARAHNSLGVIAAQEGRLDEAVARWRTAVELDPRDYQTLFNLGTTLRKQGRTEEARPFLEAYVRRAPAALEGRDLARVREWLAATPSPGVLAPPGGP